MVQAAMQVTSTHQEELRVQCLAQGLFGTITGEVGVEPFGYWSATLTTELCCPTASLCFDSFGYLAPSPWPLWNCFRSILTFYKVININPEVNQYWNTLVAALLSISSVNTKDPFFFSSIDLSGEFICDGLQPTTVAARLGVCWDHASNLEWFLIWLWPSEEAALAEPFVLFISSLEIFPPWLKLIASVSLLISSSSLGDS